MELNTETLRRKKACATIRLMHDHFKGALSSPFGKKGDKGSAAPVDVTYRKRAHNGIMEDVAALNSRPHP